MAEERLVSTLIVDDEPYSRRYLRELIEGDARFRVVQECDGGQDAIEVCRTMSPDVIYLDIEMPQVDGFDVLHAIADSSPLVVIVSAFSHYAVKAFDCEVFDYVIKPICPKRFSSAADRVFKRYQEKRLYASLESGSRQGSHTNAQDDTAVKSKKMLHTVEGKLLYENHEIQYLESMGNYVKVRFHHESHLVRETLVNFYNSLDSADFMRVHRSFIVNVHHIRKLFINTSGQIELVMENGEVVPVSRSRRKQVAAAIQDFME